MTAVRRKGRGGQSVKGPFDAAALNGTGGTPTWPERARPRQGPMGSREGRVCRSALTR